LAGDSLWLASKGTISFIPTLIFALADDWALSSILLRLRQSETSTGVFQENETGLKIQPLHAGILKLWLQNLFICLSELLSHARFPENNPENDKVSTIRSAGGGVEF